MTNPNVPQVVICPKCDGLNMPTATTCVYCQAGVEPLIPAEDEKHRGRFGLACLVALTAVGIWLAIEGSHSTAVETSQSYELAPAK